MIAHSNIILLIAKGSSMTLWQRILTLIMLCSMTLMASADHKGHGEQGIEIKQAWARALPPVVPNGAAYLQLTNMTKKSDILESVTSDIAKHSMLHESYFDDEKVAMRHIDKLTVASKQTVVFKPGGYHIMLMGLKRPLTAGTSFNLTLHFKHAGAIITQVIVTEKAENAAEHHHHH